MKRISQLILGALLAGVGLSLAGCGRTDSSGGAATKPPAVEKPSASTSETAHEHKPSAHGGIVVSMGQDSYHAEAVFEKGGSVRLYMLGKDEARVQEVDVQELTAYVTAEGGVEAEKMSFRPEPQQGDAKNKTSLFMAKLPKESFGKKVQIVINNIQVNGERFRISFANEVEGGIHSDAEMPTKKDNEEEQKLFLTPGGLYTEADIAANGKIAPTQKYKGIRSLHDENPKPGERICPISKTKANPKFTWVIGGKTYQFCCIPCIEEFTALAKEKPGEIKDPKEYVK